jgi:cell division protease FtsH
MTSRRPPRSPLGPKTPPDGGPTPPRPRISPIWWVILAGLLIWNFITLFGSTGQQAPISYTGFLAQVRADNVEKVQIKGDSITGTFLTPVTLAEVEAADGVTTTTTATASTTTAANTSTTTTTPVQFTEFKTTFPATVGDPTLMTLLTQHGVVVDAVAVGTSWVGLVIDVLSFVFLIGLVWWMGRRMMQGQSGVMGFGKSKARQYTTERPKTAFNDVAGADEAKAELRQVVEFLREPEKFYRLGARLPRGFLLVGPPGTGKTLLARAVAGEASVPFLDISASEFVEMFVGVGASRVRDLFDKAKEVAPAIVFIDELDAVARRRGAGLGTVNDEREQTLNQLLTVMDGFDERQSVIVLAATNRPDVLDPALLRPGRFDRQIVVPLPDRKGRLGILQIHTRSLHLAPDVDLDKLARRTIGLSGADLANIANEAALLAAEHDVDSVRNEDFGAAIDKVTLGAERHTPMSDHDRRVVAYHESGHTLVAWYSALADPVDKVTIIPHGLALGVTEQLPAEERVNYSRDYLRTRIAVMLGGRTSEELVFGDFTTGAESDIVEATKLARRMVTRWGMGSFGPLSLDGDEDQPFLGFEMAQGRNVSEATQSRIDQDVQALIDGQHKAARSILETHREELDKLVELLMDHETVETEELRDVLGPPSFEEPAEEDTR